MLEKFKIAVIAIALASLAACGGGDGSLPSKDSSTDTGSDSEGAITPTKETGVSYYPLQMLHSYEEYGFNTPAFLFNISTGVVFEYLINPVNSTSLAPISTAVASDFKITEDSFEVESTEAFPMLQRIVGTPVTLKTAIVVDTSGSMDAVSKSTLIAAIKTYIAAAKASSDTAIKNQQFTIWAFGQNVAELTSGFTTNSTTLNTALDTLETNWGSHTYGRSSSLFKSIVQSVGYFAGTAANDVVYDFSLDGSNDLIESVNKDAVVLGSVVLFSAGSNGNGDFDAEDMTNALTWQAMVVYDTSASGKAVADTSSATPDGTKLLGKALYYVQMGATTDDTVKAAAETVINVGSTAPYNFSSALVSAQIAGIDKRINRNNQYLLRYASAPREGKHLMTLETQTKGYSYALTTEIEYLSYVNSGHPADELSSLVEITGPNGEYLSANTVSVANITKLKPATRWVNTTYAASEYSWTVGGTGRTAGSDGSITISAADAGQSVVLTNTTRGESATVSVTN